MLSTENVQIKNSFWAQGMGIWVASFKQLLWPQILTKSKNFKNQHIGQPDIALAQLNVALGQPVVALAQTDVALPQPDVALSQLDVASAQLNVALDQPNVVLAQ